MLALQLSYGLFLAEILGEEKGRELVGAAFELVVLVEEGHGG
jgi:hypothetical protein